MTDETKHAKPKIDEALFNDFGEKATDALDKFLDSVEAIIMQATGNSGLSKIVVIRALEQQLTFRIGTSIRADGRMECLDRLVSHMRDKFIRLAQFETALRVNPTSQKPN